jgi:uncharacterized MAPEG superfamily protein
MMALSFHGRARHDGKENTVTLAYWMLFTSAMLPYLTVAVAKYRPDYDNAAPRTQLAAAEGARLRAWWAHLNHFEAFPPFAAGVIIAHLAGASQAGIDTLAVAFVLLRVIYTMLYIADRPTARSVVWVAAFACVAGLFVAAAVA